MQLVAQVELPAEPSTPAAARRLVEAALADSRYRELTEVALLLTSELATNAVLHARTALVVEVSLNDGRLRVEVWDHSDGRPQRQPPSLDSDRGRGLALVAALAAAWGTEQGSGSKSVWFELAR